MAELLLPRRGTLVSWTTQGFPPVVPYAGDETGETFVPFGVGLVQLDDIVRVESRLTESDPGAAATSTWRSSCRWCRSTSTPTAPRS